MTTLLDIFTDPVARTMTNCVCFATQDPLAGLCRGAFNCDVVLAAIDRTPRVTQWKNGDIMIWWNRQDRKEGGGFHMARIHKGYYLEQSGIGGKCAKWKISCIDPIYGTVYKHRKRVSAFELPLRCDDRSREFFEGMYREIEETGDYTRARKYLVALVKLRELQGADDWPVEGLNG